MNMADNGVEMPLPFHEWPLVWEWGTLRGYVSRGRGKIRQQVQIPFRRCPHGGYFFDAKIAPPPLADCWGSFALKTCDSAVCKDQYRTNERTR